MNATRRLKRMLKRRIRRQIRRGKSISAAGMLKTPYRKMR